ncbi:MAG: tetratricopeptide repeat protein [Isosphaeraceae bacterium]
MQAGLPQSVPLATGTPAVTNREGTRPDSGVIPRPDEAHEGGSIEEAILQCEKILAEDKENVQALNRLGVLNHQIGNSDRAIELIGKALALSPNRPGFHANLAEAYRAAGQPERAAGCCRVTLRLWPESVEAICNLALALQALGGLEEAIDQFRRALELRPDLAPVHNNLGVVLRELDRLDEAFEHFRRAVELDPAFAPARSNLGQMLLDRGNAEQTLVHCQEAVRLQPNVPALHYNLGNALRSLERYADARAAYLEALRLDPDLAPAYAHLGLTLLREGQPGQALPWIKQSVELAPNEWAFHRLLGDSYADLQEFSEAIACYERAIALTGQDHAELYLALGRSLLDDGRLAPRPRPATGPRSGSCRTQRSPWWQPERSILSGASWPRLRHPSARRSRFSRGCPWPTPPLPACCATNCRNQT